MSSLDENLSSTNSQLNLLQIFLEDVEIYFACLIQLIFFQKYLTHLFHYIYLLLFYLLVCDLRQARLLAGKGLVQVKQLQLGVVQVAELGREHGRLHNVRIITKFTS